jgi:outer membrane protein assembly factor BamD
MRRTRPFLFLSWVAAAFLLVSCSKNILKNKGLSDSALFSIGTREAAGKRYGKAAKAFEALLQRYPTSALAPRAQLHLADARMDDRNYPEAEVAYDTFLRLYPANDNAAYALFRKAELLRRQVRNPNRGQTKTEEALRTYERLRKTYPSSRYAAESWKRIAALRERLAEHEAVVVTHYLSSHQYLSAEFRARRALATYSDTASAPRLMSLLAKALERQGKRKEAIEVRTSLREKFPGGRRRSR